MQRIISKTKILLSLFIIALVFSCSPEDGIDGVNGTNGQDGANGIDGQNGANGTDGTNGQIGANGANGQNAATYTIGEFAQGGIIFWIDDEGQHGLVSAKVDQSIGMRWYPGTDGDTRAYGDGVFAGETNTAIIISAHVAIGDDGNIYAARLSNELQITQADKTYGDWYLPSKEELNLLYQNKVVIDATAIVNGGVAFANEGYWSSTESNDFGAWRQSFSNSDQAINFKNVLNNVRSIRAF